MAKPPDPFFAYVEELFATLGPVRIKRMFGGAGVFAEDVMFALIADDVVYLKTDTDLRAALEAEGCEPFVYTKLSTGETADMGYLALPADALDDPDEASAWARRALNVAISKKRQQGRRSRG